MWVRGDREGRRRDSSATLGMTSSSTSLPPAADRRNDREGGMTDGKNEGKINK